MEFRSPPDSHLNFGMKQEMMETSINSGEANTQ